MSEPDDAMCAHPYPLSNLHFRPHLQTYVNVHIIRQ